MSDGYVWLFIIVVFAWWLNAWGRKKDRKTVKQQLIEEFDLA